MGNLNMDASLKSAFASSMQRTYSEASQSWQKTTIKQTIDPTKPTYIYTTTMLITIHDGESYMTIAGDGVIIQNHAAQTTCASQGVHPGDDDAKRQVLV